MRLSFERSSAEAPRRPPVMGARAAKVYKCLNCSMELSQDSDQPTNIYSRRFCSGDCRQAYLTPNE